MALLRIVQSFLLQRWYFWWSIPKKLSALAKRVRPNLLVVKRSESVPVNFASNRQNPSHFGPRQTLRQRPTKVSGLGWLVHKTVQFARVIMHGTPNQWINRTLIHPAKDVLELPHHSMTAPTARCIRVLLIHLLARFSPVKTSFTGARRDFSQESKEKNGTRSVFSLEATSFASARSDFLLRLTSLLGR